MEPDYREGQALGWRPLVGFGWACPSLAGGNFLLFFFPLLVQPEGTELDSQNLSPNSFSKNCPCTLTFNPESAETLAVKALGTQRRNSWCGGLLALLKSRGQASG